MSLFSICMYHKDGEAQCWLDDINVEFDDGGGPAAVPTMKEFHERAAKFARRATPTAAAAAAQIFGGTNL